jgi:TolA-binding protein
LVQAQLLLLHDTASRATVQEHWIPAAEGITLGAGEPLRTEPAAQALLDIPEISALLVSPDTQLGIERSAQGVTVRLARGTVTAKVAHRKPGESFVVQTDDARVTVVGTLFSVTAGRGGGITEVSVHEGTVAVSTPSGESERVVGGTRWSSNHPGRESDRITPAVATLLEACLANPKAEALRPLFDATQLALAAPTATSAPVAAVAFAEAGPSIDTTAPVKPHASVHRVAIAALSPHNPTITPPAQPTVTSPLPASEPVPDDPYGRAVELETKGQHAEAAVAFAHAADVDPRHAELALYELGRIERLRLHDPQKALEAFEQYRSRYPAGALLPEVDFTVVEIDGALGKASDQAAESEHFIAAHPTDEHVDDVRLSLGHVRRDQDDCVRALPLYRAITKASRLDDATYSIAYCQAKLGDRTGADQTLRSYLARFPQGTHRADALKALGEDR